MLYIKTKAEISTIMRHLLTLNRMDQNKHYEYVMRELYDPIVENGWHEEVMKKLEEIYGGEIYDDGNDWECVLEDVAEAVEQLYRKAAYEEYVREYHVLKNEEA